MGSGSLSDSFRQRTAHHAVAVELGLLEELGHLLHVHAQHMVGQQIAGVIEPELAHLGQNGALFGDLVFQDDVKRRNAVSGNHDQAVAIVVDLADFAFFDGFELSHNQTLHFFHVLSSAAAQRSSYPIILPYCRAV